MKKTKTDLWVDKAKTFMALFGILGLFTGIVLTPLPIWAKTLIVSFLLFIWSASIKVEEQKK